MRMKIILLKKKWNCGNNFRDELKFVYFIMISIINIFSTYECLNK